MIFTTVEPQWVSVKQQMHNTSTLGNKDDAAKCCEWNGTWNLFWNRVTGDSNTCTVWYTLEKPQRPDRLRGSELLKGNGRKWIIAPGYPPRPCEGLILEKHVESTVVLWGVAPLGRQHNRAPFFFPVTEWILMWSADRGEGRRFVWAICGQNDCWLRQNKTKQTWSVCGRINICALNSPLKGNTHI